jgi:small conductance mechanosensitive channel
VIGRWLIGVAVGMVRSALEKQKVDPAVLRYVGSIVTVTLNILLVIGILGYFGVQITTFAALIAAAGIAIGAAVPSRCLKVRTGTQAAIIRRRPRIRQPTTAMRLRWVIIPPPCCCR